jgi:hypothetical protein
VFKSDKVFLKVQNRTFLRTLKRYDVTLDGHHIDALLDMHKGPTYDVNMYDRIDLFKLLSTYVLLGTYKTVFCIDILKPLVAEIPSSIIEESKSVYYLTPLENWLLVCSVQGRDTILQLINDACKALPTLTHGDQKGLYTHIFNSMEHFSGRNPQMEWLSEVFTRARLTVSIPRVLEWCQKNNVTTLVALRDAMQKFVDELQLKEAREILVRKAVNEMLEVALAS